MTRKHDDPRQMQVCTHLSRFALVSRVFPGRYAKKYTGYCIIACVPMWVRTPVFIQFGVSRRQMGVGARWVQIAKMESWTKYSIAQIAITVYVREHIDFRFSIMLLFDIRLCKPDSPKGSVGGCSRKTEFQLEIKVQNRVCEAVGSCLNPPPRKLAYIRAF